MNRKQTLQLLTALSFAAVTIQPANAASQDECAIWLCAPGGFPAGCEAAKSALKDRIKDGKSPLPPFSECAVKDDITGTDPKDFTYSFDRVIRIREHQVCYGDEDSLRHCKTIPAHDKPGRSCWTGGKDGSYIRGCIGAFKRIKVFEKGKQLGETYYFQ